MNRGNNEIWELIDGVGDDIWFSNRDSIGKLFEPALWNGMMKVIYQINIDMLNIPNRVSLMSSIDDKLQEVE